MMDDASIYQRLFLGWAIGMGIVIACFFSYWAGMKSVYRYLRKQAEHEDDVLRRHECLPPRKD